MTKTDNIYGVFDGSWALLTAGTEEKYNTMTNLWRIMIILRSAFIRTSTKWI